MTHLAVGLVVALGLLATPVAAQNLIANGDFETPIVSPTGFTDFPVGSAAIPGWTVFGPPGTVVSVVGGSFSQLGVTFPARNGVQWLDLTGNGSNAPEGVQQTVSTVAGGQYQLSFYLGNTTGGGIFGSTSTVDVLVNGAVAFTDTNSSINPTSLTWQQFTHTFTATGSSTTIGFRNADPAADNSNALDNVVLITAGGPVTPTSDIPTLSEWAVMLLMGVLAWLGVTRLRHRPVR